MTVGSKLAAGLLVLAVTTGPTLSAEPVKIGFITTLSTTAGYLGEDVRDGFLLAVKEGGGKLGGVPVEVLVEDDNLKPANARQIAEKMMQREGVKLFTGLIFSNTVLAAVPAVLEKKGLFVGLNGAPSQYAGAGCHKYYFQTAWQNDSLHEATGQLATNLGYRRAVLLAANYPAGKDAISGFKRYFKGDVVEEIYTRLDQTDFSAEMARIRSLKPDVVFQGHSGGQGIAFLKQYAQAGLKDEIPMVLSEPSLEQRTAAAAGSAAVGLVGSSHWNTDFDNPVNTAFVKNFTDSYGRSPSVYASQGYDAALLIGSALKASGGSLDPDSFRKGLLATDAKLTRGPFRFGPNQHPVESWYQVKAEAGADGQVALKTVGPIFEQRGDSHSDACKL
jgi:ABC-type branched-chain amino acid transport systems, periplasmic component